MTNRFCFPPAATPSSLATSCEVNLSYAVRAPVKLASMRVGVTDLGSTTMPLATMKTVPFVIMTNVRMDGRSLTEITQQNIGCLQVMLGRNFCNYFIYQQRRVCRTERRVCLSNNCLGFQVVQKFELRVVQMKLQLIKARTLLRCDHDQTLTTDLINSRDDFCGWKNLLKHHLREV